MKGQNQFEKYANLVRKSAHYYAKKWRVDYEELEAQGFLIYCECLESFDIHKGCKFSTHLTWELKRLNDYCQLNNRQSNYELYDDFGVPESRKISYIDLVEDDKNYNDEVDELLNSAYKVLSKTSYNVLKWIIDKNWECKGKRTPSISLIMKTFNLTQKRAKEIWSELKNYWNSIGIYCYA